MSNDLEGNLGYFMIDYDGVSHLYLADYTFCNARKHERTHILNTHTYIYIYEI